MTKSMEGRPLHDFAGAVLFCILLAAASPAAAQGQEIVYSVDQWPKMSARKDAKLTALSFSFGAQPTGLVPAKPTDVVLTIPVGEPVALFMKSAFTHKSWAQVLIEFPLVGPNPAPRAPFAVRLKNVIVTSVQVSKPRGDAGPGIAEVKLSGTALEVFTATQDPTGAVKPGQQFKWDFARDKESP